MTSNILSIKRMLRDSIDALDCYNAYPEQAEEFLRVARNRASIAAKCIDLIRNGDR